MKINKLTLTTLCTIILFSCNNNLDTEEKNSKKEPPPLAVFNSFKELKEQTKSVKLFLYVPLKSRSLIIEDSTDKISEFVVDSFTRKLSVQEIDTVFKILEIPDQNIGAECFWPRHAIIFFDKEKNMLGHLSICFSCGNFLFSENLKFSSLGLKELKTFFNEQNIPTPHDTEEYWKYIGLEIQ